ncbi:MAG: DNA translocase FtsK [Patescibacteria group bacterium]|jgi:S-DNA-T family DNA segregation ATPase FtsK/SpoIIIE
MARKPKKPTKRKTSKTRRRRSKNQTSLQLSPKVVRSVAALLMYIGAFLIILSFFNQGLLLQSLRKSLVILFGWGVVFIPLIFLFAGNILLKPAWKISRPTLLLGSIILFISLISLTKAGSIGEEFWVSLAMLVSGLGSFAVFFAGVLIGIMVFFEISLADFIAWFESFKESFAKDQEPALDFEAKAKEFEAAKEPEWDEAPLLKATTNPNESQVAASISKEDASNTKTDKVNQSGLMSPTTNTASDQVWKLPPLSLLSTAGSGKADLGDVKRNAQTIEETLESFGVRAKVVDWSPGPTVTQYAIQLAIGTKLNKVTSLANDLAMRLAAKTGQIRIEAPIPGKALVGIEVPNLSSSTVTLRQMLNSPEMKRNPSKLLVGLGLDVAGNHVTLDIGKMPHILIAGQTGSGKSVCINVILSSILFRCSPSEVKFILVDPKRVELSTYNAIPHLLSPVIIEPEKVVSALKWTIAEMENRYKIFAEVGARNIESYNEMTGFHAMPYILVVIDELADIMLYAPSEVEDAINRLAQMARATGIHLVLATQRPSVDVITGLIKANIPARIAFSVSSMMDSRVILDTPGAEKLLGKGDMLFIPPDQAKPRRIQGAFLSDSDIRNLTTYLKNNGISTQYTEEVTSKYKGGSGKGSASIDGRDEDLDDMFEEAVRVICNYDRASASLLQRKLSIGYNRAARILDQLFEAGVISPPDGSKPREVLIKNADEFFAKRAEQAR